MKVSALGSVVVVALLVASVGCGGGMASHDGGGGTTGGGGTSAGGGGGTSGTGGATAGTRGGATCAGTAPCGGNLIGTWNFVSYCVDDAYINEQLASPTCPAAKGSNFTVTRTGSIVFTATDYTSTSIGSVAYTYTFPASCIADGSTCAAFAASLAATPMYESATCAGSTTCVCQLAMTPSNHTESGTYTTSGAALTLTTMPANGAAGTVSYCVQGDRLQMLDIDPVTMRTRFVQVAQRQ